MDKVEKIQGERRISIFQQMQRDKTLLRMRLPDKDYEALTILTGLRFQGKNPLFLIEESNLLKEVLRSVPHCRIDFEFIGRDNLQYSFKAFLGQVLADEIRIGFPEFIERIQRRKHFRLKVPIGTELHFEVDSKRCIMSVINISLGGVFGGLVSSEKGTKRKPIVKKSEHLRDVLIYFPYEKKDWRVIIKEIMAKRVTKDPFHDRYLYAFQFTEIEKEENNILKGIIYDLQRIILRKRLPV